MESKFTRVQKKERHCKKENLQNKKLKLDKSNKSLKRYSLKEANLNRFIRNNHLIRKNLLLAKLKVIAQKKRWKKEEALKIMTIILTQMLWLNKLTDKLSIIVEQKRRQQTNSLINIWELRKTNRKKRVSLKIKKQKKKLRKSKTLHRFQWLCFDCIIWLFRANLL